MFLLLCCPTAVRVFQSCPTLWDPKDYTVHGILQARILEWVVFPTFRGSFQTRDWTQVPHHCRQILYQLSHQGSPRILEWVAYPFSRGSSSQTRDWTQVSCIAGRFFTRWATREALQQAHHQKFSSYLPPQIKSTWPTLPDPHPIPLVTTALFSVICVLICIWLIATPWTVARQAPLSMGFSRQEYWSGLSCPPPGDLPDPGIEPASPVSLAWQVDLYPLSYWGSHFKS